MILFLSCFFELAGQGGAAPATPSTPSKPVSRPHVLLICVDDLKPLLGCYGARLVRSPHIDKFAGQATRFDAAYCNQAVCSPSRNALLTGFRPQTLGIYDLGTNFRLSQVKTVTLPQYFMGNGYHAQGLGKIFHVGHGNINDTASWSVPSFPGKVVDYVLPANQRELTREEALFDNKSGANLPKGAATESAEVPDDAYSDGKVAREAIRRMTKASNHPEKPMFMAVGFLKPHLPFCAPKKYWDLYKAGDFALPSILKAPAGAPPFAPTQFGELRNYRDIPEKGEFSEELQRRLIHGYHAAVSYMDSQVGLLLEALEASPMRDNTVVILWGDHGWHLGDHGMWCKHTNYEQAARIPLIVRIPGQKVPVVSRSMVESVDVYPTLCRLAGLPPPLGLDGQSFHGALPGSWDPEELPVPRQSVTHVFPRGQTLGRAIRTPTHRLVEWKTIGAAADTAQIELYDYASDALETKNRASEQPEKVARLRAILAKQPEATPQVKRAPGKKVAGQEPGTDRKALFARKDKNNDGKLTLEEFLAGQVDPDKAPDRFRRFDVNGDGELSQPEFMEMGKLSPGDRH